MGAGVEKRRKWEKASILDLRLWMSWFSWSTSRTSVKKGFLQRGRKPRREEERREEKGREEKGGCPSYQQGDAVFHGSASFSTSGGASVGKTASPRWGTIQSHVGPNPEWDLSFFLFLYFILSLLLSLLLTRFCSLFFHTTNSFPCPLYASYYFVAQMNLFLLTLPLPVFYALYIQFVFM